VAAWNEHEAPRLAAALAFYTILSLAPLMILTVAMLALILQRSAAEDQLLRQVGSLIGSQGAQAVRGMIEQTQHPASSALASIAAIATLLWGASSVFGELRSALNQIWKVQGEAASGIWEIVKQRFFSFGMVLAVGFLLLVSLVISAGLAALGKFSAAALPLPEAALSAINLGVSLAGTSGLFTLIFRYVPDMRNPWKDVWIGGDRLPLHRGKVRDRAIPGHSGGWFSLWRGGIVDRSNRVGLLFRDDLFVGGCVHPRFRIGRPGQDHAGGLGVRGSRNASVLLGGRVGLGGIRKDERRLARPQQLQLLADFHFLLGGALFQSFDALAAALVFGGFGGVLLFQLAHFLALVEQRGNALGSA
jgi:YihY family inner membrane protein